MASHDVAADAAADAGTSMPSPNSHLTFPAPSAEAGPSSAPAAPPRPLLQQRLYVGNLHPTVDEYTLLQVFSKFGRVSKLDFLFHKAGPHKGRPRGYAFVEYPNTQDAQRALAAAHDKLLRGRHLVVTLAHQAPLDNPAAPHPARRTADAARPTTLSMLKSAPHGRADATDAKIARMEAKLRQMDQADPVPVARNALHPSLPARPPPSVPAPTTTRRPALPVKVKIGAAGLGPGAGTGAGPVRTEQPRRSAPLAGVRIVKHKDR